MKKEINGSIDTFYQKIFNDANKKTLKIILENIKNYKNLEDYYLADANEKELIEVMYDIETKIDELDDLQTNTHETELLTIYNYNKYSLYFESWETLNIDNKPYPKFLLEDLLPKFYPMPESEIQYPVLVCAMLLNTATLPPLGENCGKETPVPLIGLIGQPGTGKTQIKHLLSAHYPNWAKATIKGNSSGFAALELMNDICYVDGLSTEENIIFRPSLIVFENIYFQEFITRLGHHYVSILSIERSDSIAYVGSKNNKDRDNNVYYCHCAKWFTSVQNPAKESKKMGELLRRSLLFFTDFYTSIGDGKAPESAANYNWHTLKKVYHDLWNKKDVEERFFKHLSEVMSLKDDSTCIKPANFPPSQLIIATGLFFNIWNDINEAANAMAKYWQFVENYNSKDSGNLLYKIIENWLDNNYYALLYNLTKTYPDKTKVNLKRASFELKRLLNAIEQKSNGIYRANTQITDKIQNILSQKNLVIKIHNDKTIVIDKSIIHMLD